MNKIETFIGFAIKSGAVQYGVDNIIKSGSRIQLVLINGEEETSSKQKIVKFCNRNNIKVKILKEKSFQLKNVQAIGILNENLATQILKQD